MQLNLYALSMMVAAVISGPLTLYSWQRRSAPGATFFSLLMLAVTYWSLTYGIELTNLTSVEPFFWKLEYFAIPLVPVLWVLFTLEYTGREHWLTRLKVALFFVIPAITIALQWTNEWHHLIYQDIQANLSGPLPLPIITYGPWFWMHMSYSYLLLLVGTVLMAQMALRSARLYRVQTGVVLLGAVLPSLVNVLYVARVKPFDYLDFTPWAFTLTGLLVGWGLFRYRLFDLVPAARDRVVENIKDGMLVFDAQNRLVDCNPAARQIFDWPQPPLGSPAAEILNHWPDVLHLCYAADAPVTEIHRENGLNRQFYELYASTLTNRRGRTMGRIIVAHDITDRKRAQTAEQEARQHEMTLARNIQTSLLPQAAPNIPGLDIATLCLPAREVGGDLYAYHELPPNPSNPRGGYALAVGDVSGKGIPAALYMAAFTILLASKAPFVPDVTELLTQLNYSLYPYMFPHRMNTALCYVRLEAEEDNHYTAHIANAGLIAPILRRGPHCRYLDVSGLPLGVMPDEPVYHTLTLPLQTNDILVIYSDGLVEAMNANRELYGFSRLLAAVTQSPVNSAQTMQEAILADARAFAKGAEQHDDMTLMVIRLK